MTVQSVEFDWVDFYKEFAEKLLAFKGDRKPLVKMILEIFSEIQIELPTLEKDKNVIDICPFTVFGLFNKSSLREENRKKIISAFAKHLSIQSPIPKSFNSIPVLNNQNATFYYFIGERKDDDIDNLWSFFEAAILYAKNPEKNLEEKFAHYFDLVINSKGNGNSKITMGLYWLNPDFYMSIDSRNTWYIYETGNIPDDVVKQLPVIEGKISSRDYLKISKILHEYTSKPDSKFENFKNISFEAWRYSEEVNKEKKAEQSQSSRDDKGAALADENVDTVHYWIYAPGNDACYWDDFYKKDIMAIGWGEIGDLSAFSSKDEMKQKMKEKIDPSKPYKNDAHATWQFANEMKPGDIIFVKKGMHKIIGRGIVTSDYRFEPNAKDYYNNVRDVNWINNEEKEHPGQAVLKTLTDITPYTEYVQKLTALYDGDITEQLEESEKIYPPYDSDCFLEEVYMNQSDYDTLTGLLRSKKNIILQGAPGVGKTFAAKRLAYSILGMKDQSRVALVQFHQSYSYEDFIEGYRPTSDGNGFTIRKGVFYNFCTEAANNLDKDYFFIIDEINRGNLSKIFGELFMLIEADKRGNPLKLLYSEDSFIVPKNVYIIGMMNTADRSLAMLDYALRRRFAFYDIKPAFQSDGFRKYRMELNSDKFNRLIECVEQLNDFIKKDDSLGEGFCIGHSYFCGLNTIDNSTLNRIVEYELIPLIKEYWFDEASKVKDWSENLRSSIK